MRGIRKVQIRILEKRNRPRVFDAVVNEDGKIDSLEVKIKDDVCRLSVSEIYRQIRACKSLYMENTEP